MDLLLDLGVSPSLRTHSESGARYNMLNKNFILHGSCQMTEFSIINLQFLNRIFKRRGDGKLQGSGKGLNLLDGQYFHFAFPS